MNTGSGEIGNGHPALQDVRVRQAIAHAIDKDTLVSRVLDGLGTPGQSMNVARRTEVEPQGPRRPAAEVQPRAGEPDPRRRGLQEGLGRHPNDERRVREEAQLPLLLPIGRRRVLTRRPVHQGVAEGHRHRHHRRRRRARTSSPRSRTRVSSTSSSGRGRRTPTPTAQMSYLTCAQVPKKPDDGLYNDAFYCDPEYDQLFNEQKTELDETKRVDLVHQALQRFYDQAPYVVLYRAGHDRGLPQRPVHRASCASRPRPDRSSTRRATRRTR